MSDRADRISKSLLMRSASCGWADFPSLRCPLETDVRRCLGVGSSIGGVSLGGAT